MTVILKLVDGGTDIFETEKYLITNAKEMNPFIMSVKVIKDNDIIFQWKRKRPHHYKKHFVPPKVELTPEEQQERAIQTELQ